MQILKIVGVLWIKRRNDPKSIMERMAKKLQENNFVTEQLENRIIFNRSIQFTNETGENRTKLFMLSYGGVINLLNKQGNFQYEYSLNISAQLFKSSLLIILIFLISYYYTSSMHIFLFLLIFVAQIMIHKAIIKDHFTSIIKQ